jgi:hypothetical protein
MKNRRGKRAARILAALLVAAVAAPLCAANIRNFIEAVRRKAAVVYVGTVKEVRLLERTKFDVKAQAVITLSAVARGQSAGEAEALVDYSSYDDKTPMLAGGPQYQLHPGTMVVIFAGSLRDRIPPGYLLHGSREELLKRVTTLGDRLKQMPAEELKRNEIDEEDRQVQLALYEKLRGHLRPHPGSDAPRDK